MIEVDTMYGANHVFPDSMKFLASSMLSLNKRGQHERLQLPVHLILTTA